MARVMRTEYFGVVYHITARGMNEKIFLNDREWRHLENGTRTPDGGSNKEAKN